MEKHDKIRMAVTAGILALIVLVALIVNTRNHRSDETAAGTTASAREGESAGQIQDDDSDPATGATGTAKPSGAFGAERAATAVGTFAEDETSASAADSASLKVVTAKDIEGYDFFEPDTAVLRDSYETVSYDTDAMLKELFGYWEAGNLEAVRELISLPRFEAISASLKGSSDYYYHGGRNADGLPDGKGVAVYADNQYYYGDFVAGVRKGKGEWMQRYPAYNRNVVIEHYYTGEWDRDLPNGKGQDHYDYNENRMEEDKTYLLNAIGPFTDGMYDGEMYVMIEGKDGTYTEWTGNCDHGTFEVTIDADHYGKVAIMHAYEDADHWVWINPDKNKDFGVDHLIAPSGAADAAP